jgi:3-hydroxyacyl-[acyl-carrier-protein] dehydratase
MHAGTRSQRRALALETAALDILEIQSLLPHRFPFLLVDRVVELTPDRSLRAFKNVSANEHFFEGHFPGHPVMPGVLIVEALAQAAALLALKSAEHKDSNVIYLMGLDGVRFRRPVVPGDRLDLHVELLRRKGKVWKLRGEAHVEGKLCCEAELMATIADLPSDAPAGPHS